MTRAPVSQDAAQLVERLRSCARMIEGWATQDERPTLTGFGLNLLFGSVSDAADAIEALTRVQPSTGLDMGAGTGCPPHCCCCDHYEPCCDCGEVKPSRACIGEKCWCGASAAKKVGEEILFDDPNPARHNLTRYICAFHYAQLMGPLGAKQVGLDATHQGDSTK